MEAGSIRPQCEELRRWHRRASRSRVRFLAVSQSLDTDDGNPTSRLLLHILASVAEFEREMIRERVTCGLKTAKAKGKRLGRPKRVFRRDEALQMRAEGMSWRGVARALEVPVSTVIDACLGV